MIPAVGCFIPLEALEDVSTQGARTMRERLGFFGFERSTECFGWFLYDNNFWYVSKAMKWTLEPYMRERPRTDWSGFSDDEESTGG